MVFFMGTDLSPNDTTKAAGVQPQVPGEKRVLMGCYFPVLFGL
jgi:hypothetical protein